METTRKYSWKYGNRFDAQMVGEAFEAIEHRDGTLTKEAVVEAARPEDSPMHGMFEWDNDIAAEKYRLEQAHYYIRQIKCEVVPVGNINGKPVTVRGWVNVAPVEKTDGTGLFVSSNKAIEDADMYAIMLDRAKRELLAFSEKYSNIKELQPVFAVINQVAMTL